MPCAFAIRSTITAQPGLHSLYSTGSGGATATFTKGRAGLALFAATRLFDRFAAALSEARLTGRLRRPAVRVVRVARIVSSLTELLFFGLPVSRLSALLSFYFRRSTICLSVRLLCLVFLPSVGKAHGVCG